MPLYQNKRDSAIFEDPDTGKKYQLNDVFEGSYYDTVNFASTIAASTKVFKNLSDKNKQHCNLTQAQKIPGEHAFVLQRIGVDVLSALGSSLSTLGDMKQILCNSYFEFKLGTRLVSEGILLDYPAGRGVTGGVATTVNASTQHTATNGVPSKAATPSSLQPQLIDDKKDLNCEIKLDSAAWVTSYSAPSITAAPGTAVQVLLAGLISKPITA